MSHEKLAINPGIAEIGKIVHGIVEVKIVVEHAIHKVLQVVDTGHSKAAFNHIGMFEERVRGVICAEGSAHGGDGEARRLTIVPDKGNDFLAQVGIEDRLHVAAMKGMRGLVVKAQAVDRIHAVKFKFAAVDEVSERADQGLSFELELVARARGKADQWRTIVAIDDHAEFETQAM